jgi:alkylation response protein AidB-like acyl-CoA dehydrogenase
LFGFLAAQVAAVGLGVARGAIQAFVQLAGEKVPLGARRSIAQRSVVQLQVAQAEAAVLSAREFLFGTVRSLWDAAVAGEELTLAQRARLRLAATHAVTSSAHAVDLMYNAGGASSIYSTHPLQRHFRDIHVVTQHAMVAPTMHELVGRHLLGLDVDVGQL